MKEIVISIAAIALIAVAAHYGLEAMNWTAANTYSSPQNVRL